MKLKRAFFDRYVGKEEQRNFTAPDYDLELDDRNRITITPLSDKARAALAGVLVVVAHNVDMYPVEERPVEPQPARALPAKTRSRA